MDMVMVIAAGTVLAWAGMITLILTIGAGPLDPKKERIGLVGGVMFGAGLIMAFVPGMVFWLVRGVFPY